jgi:hypothetical protein
VEGLSVCQRVHAMRATGKLHNSVCPGRNHPLNVVEKAWVENEKLGSLPWRRG